MLEQPLTSAQVRVKLIECARGTLIAHQPDANGHCPICGAAECEPLRRARDYLATRDPAAAAARVAPVAEPEDLPPSVVDGTRTNG